jgi:predicted RND superfamily exporter protein
LDDEYVVGGELSGGAIAGIVVGVTVGVLLIVAGVILLVCWRRRRYGNKKMPPVGSLTVYTDAINDRNKIRLKSLRTWMMAHYWIKSVYQKPLLQGHPCQQFACLCQD